MEQHIPNIFELVACDKLKVTLREAFRYLLNQTGLHGSIPKLGSDELVLLIDLLIEYTHLKVYKSSYAEKLYSLIRISRGSTSRSIDSVAPSLICLTIVPYIKHKIDKYFEELNYKETRTAKELHRIRIYRLLTRSSSFLNLLCMLRYTAGKSEYHNLLDALVGIRLEGRLDEGESNTNGSVTQFLAEFTGKALTLGSYVIQFLEYWNTHTNSMPLFRASLPIPEPPNREEFAHSDERTSKLCLICEHVRQNECALSNTGYVFCYSCIYKYVKSKRSCPVTGHPAAVDNIVRLFTSSPS